MELLRAQTASNVVRSRYSGKSLVESSSPR
jgi:hypothetical protein